VDDGPGIASAHVPHLFECFYRGDPARAGSPAGSGLGLPIAQWIVQAHDGTLTITSQEGEGTSCEVWLPPHRPASGSR
jgi:two-component system OmpR family sensor kinase